MEEFKRGVLTDDIQKIAKDFLGREITIEELRLYPYLDYVLKNHFALEPRKINKIEMNILSILEKEFHVLVGEYYFRCTREFYDYIQNVLAISYVPCFLTKENLQLLESGF